MPIILTPKGKQYLKKLFSSRKPIRSSTNAPTGSYVSLAQNTPPAVKRDTRTYLERQGWTLSNGSYPPVWHGYYRTRHGISYKGKIEHSTPPQFYIYKPPEGLTTRHSHKACFTKLADSWVSVHFRIMPRDLDSGVIKLQRILHEAYLTQKSA